MRVIRVVHLFSGIMDAGTFYGLFFLQLDGTTEKYSRINVRYETIIFVSFLVQLKDQNYQYVRK